MNIDAAEAARKEWDCIVVGGGPAGCQSALYAASEGLKVLLMESGKIGGQIGQTPHLENLLGYEYGVSGPCLAAQMETQLLRLGVRILPEKATGLALNHVLTGTGKKGLTLTARSVILATGYSWQSLTPIPHASLKLHLGPSECLKVNVTDQDVIVIGGGNSAAQGILALANRARTVHVVCREKLKASSFLANRIREQKNVRLYENAKIGGYFQNSATILFDPLESGRVKRFAEVTVVINHIFACAAAHPNTAWLKDVLDLDAGGHILTGKDLLHLQNVRLPNETSMRGIFAIGDIRSGNPRRVAAAMGDAARTAPQLHERLASGAPASVAA